MATIAAKLGLSQKVEQPEIDDRCAQWLNLFGAASRGRPYTNGQPLALPPLDVLDLADRLSFPAQPEEALEVIGEMDNEWLEWARKHSK